MIGTSWLVFAGIVIAICCLRRRGKKLRPVRAHVHATGDLRRAARHEGGHGAVGRHVGGRIGTARVYPDGSGWIEVHPPSRGFTPAEEIAISLAGGMAEGASIGSSQCRGDKANMDAALRGVPSKDRAKVRAEAKRLARHGLSSQSGTAKSIARKLEKTGHL